jgi:hypothetical protein
MKIVVRIPRQKYAYIEAEVSDSDKMNVVEELEKKIQEIIPIVDKYTTTDLEVIVNDKKCPRCGKRVVEMIGISEKTNAPYHRIKCEDKDCEHIQWVSVSRK